MNWLIAVPVWGNWYVDRFIGAALPSHLAALKNINSRVRYLIHTDQPERIAAAMAHLEIECRPVPKAVNPYLRFGAAHREALEDAKSGECVGLLNADIVLSREVFMACEARFASGKRAVICAATRTLSEGNPPADAPASELLDWTMRHAHPSIKECFWGSGRTMVPWAVYYRNGDDITLRGFHLHPVAVFKDRPLSFSNTIDDDLLLGFDRNDVHVVTDRHELALAEISPRGRTFGTGNLISADSIAKWAARRANKMHWWLASHRIIIAGDGRTDDEAIWRQVVASSNAPDFVRRNRAEFTVSRIVA